MIVVGDIVVNWDLYSYLIVIECVVKISFVDIDDFNIEMQQDELIGFICIVVKDFFKVNFKEFKLILESDEFGF